MITTTRAWWLNLSTRERRLIGTGAVLSIALLVYLLLWQPLHQQLATLREDVAQQQAELAWMRQAAANLKTLSRQRHSDNAGGDASKSVTQARASAPTSASASAALSLPTLVDQSARTAGLSEQLKRLDPQPDQRISLRFDQVEFDPLLRWLDSVLNDYGLQVETAVIEPAATTGRVDAQLVLRPGHSV